MVLSDEEKQRAAALFTAVEAACKRARRLRRNRFKNDAINWADLGCAGVEISAFYYAGDGWQFGCTAYIEEASPDCRELPDFVKQELLLAGFDDVGVITEW